MASTTTPKATGDNNIDALLKKYKWDSNTVTFSFTNEAADYADYRNIDNAKDYPLSHQPLDAFQQSVVRDWFNQYANVSLLKPVEKTGSGDRNATIRIAMSNNLGTDGGRTFTPSSSGPGGDMWFNPANFSIHDGEHYPEAGNYAYQTAGHEMGHAFGLRHGYELDPQGLRNVVTDSPRDSTEFSIMTARSYVGGPIPYTNGRAGYQQSLMMYDIRAIQQMYGANFSYNSGDTTYSFTDSAGEMQINGIGQGRPMDGIIYRTIWDGGGIDTYNFSNFFTNQVIDLTPGGWSDLNAGANFHRANLDKFGNHYARGHVFNALEYNGDRRSLIENAIGGSGNDVIFGNSVGNILNGGGGNDSIYNVTSNSAVTSYDTILGGTGNDTIIDMDSIDFDIHDGGEGIDWIDYTNYDFNSIPFVVDLTIGQSLLNEDNAETLRNIENVSGSRGSDTINGSSVDNFLQGNGGNDSLQGYAGNDTLRGDAGTDSLSGGTGNDSMDGGIGNDFYVVDSLGDIVVEQPSEDYDHVLSYVNYTLTANVEKLTLAGSSAFNSTGNSLNNSIQGNEFNNVLSGLDGDDAIYGNLGDDTLNGGTGNDVLNGGTSNDVLNGGAGDEELYGGTGSDTLTGEVGKDKFFFDNPLDGIDTITDFVVVDDVIYVEKVGFVGGLSKGFITVDQFLIGASAQDSSDRFVYNQSTGALSFDSDGVGGVAQTQFAKLPAGLAMTSQNIFVTSIGI